TTGCSSDRRPRCSTRTASSSSRTSRAGTRSVGTRFRRPGSTRATRARCGRRDPAVRPIPSTSRPARSNGCASTLPGRPSARPEATGWLAPRSFSASIPSAASSRRLRAPRRRSTRGGWCPTKPITTSTGNPHQQQQESIIMNITHSSLKLAAFLIAAATVITITGAGVRAHGHEHRSRAAREADRAAALIKGMRAATERFQDGEVAKAEGYALQFGCVSGSDSGAMGMHFVNGALVGDGELDPTRPEIVIYEPVGNGKLKLIGADFLVLADAWNAKHAAPPEMMGQLFHLFEAPNRFGLPAFYTLHVWAWKESPTRAFVHWHQNVSCNAFSGKQN